ncbi:MAG: hypothetical protein IMZ40_00590, partial [Bacilli bacterium]|nr:hypothetical protein [Bacilli bacterium]
MNPLQGLEGRVDPLAGLEERIMRGVMGAMREILDSVQSGAHPLPRGDSVQSGAPPLPRGVRSDTPRPPSSLPVRSREIESVATSTLRGPGPRRVDVLKDLKKYPFKPSFGGRNCKPEEVKSFISMLEDFFTSDYQDDDKIKSMVICLQDKARVWYDNLKNDRENRGLQPLSNWSTFKHLFLQEFLPGNYGEDMRQGLYDLKQGSLSVTQYKSKFDLHIVYFPNWGESDRVEFFLRNLKDSIRFKVNAYHPRTLDDAYGLALNFEREVNSKLEKNKSLLGKRSSEFNRSNNFKSSKFSQGSNPSQGSKFNPGQRGAMLSKEEQEEHVKKGLCFRCHKPGHRSFECPSSKRKTAALEVEQGDEDTSDGEPSKDVVPTVSAAIMNMEVEQDPTVLQIKGFLNSSFSSMILIDSGSTHNMISTSFAHKIGLPLVPIKPCSVLLPNNQTSSITHRMLKVPVNIQGVDTEVDFEVWNGARYEVILGMAWLKQVDAWIACKEGAVHGKIHNGESFTIRGKRSSPRVPMLSHLQMKRCIRKNHEVFLIHVSEVEDESKDNKRVNEFLDEFKDIFPEELTELPPRRDVDHAIDLIVDAAPIARAPYRHSLTQNVELENQLKDLLNKGYIRPSKSPWGAPVLFVKKKDGSLRLCVDYHGLNK